MCVGIGISNAPTIMSRVGGEEEEEEEDEGACFHDCLDRILSSSSSSTSSAAASDADDDDASSPTRVSANQKHRHHHISFPTFPVSVSKYDVWVSQPSSVEERRSRLLREMGLPFPEFLRSAASSDHLRPSGGSGMVRPKSDSAAGCTSPSPPNRHHCNLSSVCNSILSIRPVNNRSIDALHPPTVCGCGCGDGRTPPSTSATSSKPPKGKKCREVQDVRRESYNSNSNPSFNCGSNSPSYGSSAGGGELLEDNLDSNGSDPDQARKHVCRIKNLDNGKEFVVNEVREDGMWNMLKEVGSERQLTMEEFERWVGQSPIVRELMRRQNFEDGSRDKSEFTASGSRLKKKGGWLKSIKTVATSVTGGYKERRSSDERDTSSEKGGRRSSSATDDSQDVFFHGPERIKVRQYGKSCKELSGVFKTQEFQAHAGSIRSIKFSLDGMYLASAGEDRVIHVWKVVETERKGEMLMEKMDDVNFPMLWANGSSPEPTSMLLGTDNSFEKKKRGKTSLGRKSVSLDHVVVPETVFALDEKPLRSFQGHLGDVLDLSWSKSQHLLSSSMDKTVRLWHLQEKSCLKVFSHIDYVTCIQFNPVDDNYFISGSVDEKVRIWSIPDRQVVDYNDLHEMVTAASYTPDGQGALVGSYKGSCRLYDTSENKLLSVNEFHLHNRKKKAHHKNITGFQFAPGSEIHPHNRKKKAHHKKITGFQFAPGSASEVLITSADSRVRIVEGSNLIHKFKGFRNTKSQISASLTANGRYVICASEDSHVYVWKYDGGARTITSKNVVTATRSYEYFHSPDVSVAIPWPGTSGLWDLGDLCSDDSPGLASRVDDEVPAVDHPPTPVEQVSGDDAASLSLSRHASSPLHGIISSASNNYLFDRISQTCPEEKLVLASKNLSIGVTQNRSAWGLAIVTAGLGGEIRTFQNFGLPVQI